MQDGYCMLFQLEQKLKVNKALLSASDINSFTANMRWSIIGTGAWKRGKIFIRGANAKLNKALCILIQLGLFEQGVR